MSDRCFVLSSRLVSCHAVLCGIACRIVVCCVVLCCVLSNESSTIGTKTGTHIVVSVLILVVSRTYSHSSHLFVSAGPSAIATLNVLSLSLFFSFTMSTSPYFIYIQTQHNMITQYNTIHILGGLLKKQIAGDPAMLAGIMGFGTSACLGRTRMESMSGGWMSNYTIPVFMSTKNFTRINIYIQK